MSYANTIEAIDPKANARHVEAMLRSEFGALDHLPLAVFEEFVEIVAREPDRQCLEALAQSYGL